MSSVNTKMTALADSIRTKSGESVKLSLDGMKAAVDSISVGIELPTLSNPASSSDILSGKEAVNENGEVITGSITSKTVNDLSINGSTVTVPSGYYATAATKSVASVSQATPNISVNNNGLITASATQTAGYVVAGTKSSTHQLAFQPAKTITPTKSVQTAVSSGYFTGGAITVAAIPDSYVQPSGTLGITTNGNHDVKNYASVNVSIAGNTGGSTDNEDMLISENFNTYENNRVQKIRDYAFYSCSNLSSVSFPACTTIGGYAFGQCSNLTSVNFPACTTIGDTAFSICTKLTSANFPVCTNINYSAFANCYNLSSLTLGASTICSLSNSNIFKSTPYAGYKSSFSGTPYIYVPQSLLASYKSATNWTYFSKYFSAIESNEGGGESGNTMITFYINNQPYQAEDGMTWYEWCNSSYNTTSTISCIDDMDYVRLPNGELADSNDLLIFGRNTIISNAYYKTYYDGYDDGGKEEEIPDGPEEDNI